MAHQAAWLIRTKLIRPNMGEDALMRPRLLQLLRKQPQRALTLVCAPAGMGKTTLVVQWLHDASVPVAWYSLEGGGSDLTTFLRYLVAAVQSVFPRSCASLKALTEASNQPPVEHLAVQLINDLAELPAPLILVLDDYHCVRDLDVHEVMSRLLGHMPASLHLVITSRMEPPLPLSALRARGRMVDIRSADLRFAPDEMQMFVAAATGHPVPADLLPVLLDRTEGWAVGLRMVALSLGAAADEQKMVDLAARLAETPQYVLDYLMDEVLARQSVETQTFLLQTAILERFCAPLCAACLCAAENGAGADADQSMVVTDAQAMLDQLRYANLFLVALDGQNKWFRYHALFRELLLNRLAATSRPEAIAALHRRAANWLGNSGYIEEAIAHALRGGDSETGAQFLERSLPALLNSLDRPLLDRLVNRLPADVIESRPALLLARAWSYHFLDNARAIAPLVEKARGLLHVVSPAEQEVLLGQIDTLAGQSDWINMQPDAAIDACSRALAHLPHEHKFVRGVAQLYQCGGLLMSGRAEEAASLVDAELAQCAPELDSYSARLLMFKSMGYMITGEWTKVEQWSGALLERSHQRGYHLMTAWGRYGLGLAAHERMQIQMALQHFAAIVDLTYIAHMRCTFESHVAMANIYNAAGQRELVESHLADLDGIVYGQSLYALMPRLHSLRARLALNRGEIDEAMRHVRAQGDLAQITTTLFQNEVPPLTAARVYVAAGGSANLAQARTLLNTLNTYVRTMHHTQWAADAYLVQAQLHAKEERENEALAALRQALELCEREDAPRTLFEQGATLQPQLRYLLGRGVSVGLITRVLEATPGSTSTRSTSVGGLVEPLTNREMDVLDLLVDRLTNKEIATLLGVSTATIQTHLNNLYQKLGAENRRDAVMRARNLKILA